jgi:hypothetical protein
VKLVLIGAFLAALLFGTAGAALSQVGPADEPASRSYLEVVSNAETGSVWVDGEQVGLLGEGPWAVSPGVHTVRLLPPERYGWALERPQAGVTVAAGDTAQVRLDFDYTYSLNSSPPEATVRLLSGGNSKERTDEQLGTTPMVLARSEPLSGVLVFQKAGFDTTRLRPGDRIWNAYHVDLRPNARIAHDRMYRLPEEERTRDWLTYLSAGVAVSAGVAAVVYERKANRLQATGDPPLQRKADRYETVSHGFLAGMQLGVASFAISLVVR